jgi:hypothetical protein
VNAAIAAWQAKGVVGVTTTTSLTLNVTMTLRVAPYWAMDSKNGKVAIAFLDSAKIPSTAYYYRTPATLTCCDDLYVMPHADPTWATHSNLFFWNLNCRGGIWAGCHAVSVMEGPTCVNPGNVAQNLKFLTTNGLVNYGSHTDGTPPFNYLNYSDPVFQMMGSEDLAHSWGSETIYLPLKTTSNWHAGVKIGCYDPTHSDIPTKSDGLAVLTAYGRGFNDVNRGYVMYQGGHDIGGSNPDQVSAQREFFNWSFLVATDKAPVVTYSNIPATMTGLQMYPNFTANVTSPAGLTSFTYQWFSTIGGTFSAPTSNVSNYTPPAVGSITSAIIYCKVTDGCGRKTIEPVSVTILPAPTAPVAVNDSINFSSLCTPVPNTINVLVNDYDINGNMVNSITFIGGGNYGTFTNNGGGSVTYNPGPLFIGVDTMRYQVCDNTTPFPLCSQAKIIVNTGGAGICSIYQYYKTDSVVGDSVQFQNAIDEPDSCLGFPNQSNGSNVNSAYLNTDADSIIIRLGSVLSAGDTIRIHAASDNNSCVDFVAQGSLTSNGFVNGVNTALFSIPVSTARIYSYYNFIVTQSTQYLKIKNQITACNNNFNFDGVYVVHRGCVSASPIANGESTSTGQNATVTTNVRSNDTDPQSLPLSVSIYSPPANGTATVNGAGNIVYTPNIGYTGTEQITYKVCNSSCLCDTAILTITVTGNPCPGTKIGQFISGNATSVMSSSNVTNPNNALGVSDATNGSNANTAIIANIVGANFILNLTDTVTAGNTIVIRMAPDNNNNTTIRVQGNITNAWGSPSTTTNFNLPAGSSKIYANYNFVVNDSTRYLKFTQQTTNASADVDAMSFSFWLCRNLPNRPPQATDDTASTYVNRPVTRNVVLNDIDPDGNSLTVSIINPLAYIGTATASGGTITYTPDFGTIGTDTVTYLVCDNGTPSLCDTGRFIITNIYPGPPVGVKDNSTTLSGSPVLINVQTNDTLAVNSYSYTTSLAPALLSASNGTTVLVGNSIQYTPNAGFTGVDSFAYNICDNGIPSACDSAIVFVTVDNRFPVANADVDTTAACNSVIINVIANDTDPENGIKTVTSVSVPSNGTAVISNNQIVYTPSSSPVFTGVATFTYQVCDNGIPSRSATGNVSVTVNSNNPPSNPPTVVNDTGTTFIGQSIPISVLANDSDPDADSIRVDSTAIGLQAPTKGTLQYLLNNQIRYIPNPGTFGLDSFQYKVCDIHISGAGCINIISTCSIGKVYAIPLPQTMLNLTINR